MSDRIYLDHHTATPPCELALEKFLQASRDAWASPHAPHRMGQEIAQTLEARLQPIYDLLGASWDHTFVFAPSTGLALQALLSGIANRTEIVTTPHEDAPSLLAFKKLEQQGWTIRIGDLDAISDRTALVSLSLANGLTGAIQPLDEIVRRCRQHGALLHIEATYAIGKVPLFFDDLGADYLTFSGDRMHSIRGTAGLLVRKGRPLPTLQSGATLDNAALSALSAAASQSLLYLDTMALECARLRDLLESLLPDAQVLGADALRLPNVSCLAFAGVHPESLLYLLNRRGVYASQGGHPSPKLPRGLSFALARTTTEAEIRRAAALIAETVATLRAASKELV